MNKNLFPDSILPFMKNIDDKHLVVIKTEISEATHERILIIS